MRLKTHKYFFLSLIGLNLGLVGQATQRIPVDITIMPIQEINVIAMKSIPMLTKDDLSRGYIDIQNAVILSISSNIPWKVSAVSRQSNLYVTPPNFKPVNHIQWKTKGNKFSNFKPLESITMVISEQGVGKKEIRFDYRLNVSWTNTPPGQLSFRPEFFIEPLLLNTTY